MAMSCRPPQSRPCQSPQLCLAGAGGGGIANNRSLLFPGMRVCHSWEGTSVCQLPLLWPRLPIGGLALGVTRREGTLALLPTQVVVHRQEGQAEKTRSQDQLPKWKPWGNEGCFLVLSISFASNSGFNYVRLKIPALEIYGAVMNATEADPCWRFRYKQPRLVQTTRHGGAMAPGFQLAHGWGDQGASAASTRPHPGWVPTRTPPPAHTHNSPLTAFPGRDFPPSLGNSCPWRPLPLLDSDFVYWSSFRFTAELSRRQAETPTQPACTRTARGGVGRAGGRAGSPVGIEVWDGDPGVSYRCFKIHRNLS